MLSFTLMNAIPLGAIAYYIKYSIEQRQAELENLSNLRELSPKEVASRIESVCKSSTQFTLVTADASVSPILPHAPESAPLVLTSDELITNIDETIPGTADVFDSISASYDWSQALPLRTIHFGVSGNSGLGRTVANKVRECTIIYTGGPMRDLCVSLKGSMTVIEDERLRRFYWRDRWGTFISKKDNYLLIKFEPSQATIKSLNIDQSMVNGVTITRDKNNQWQPVS